MNRNLLDRIAIYLRSAGDAYPSANHLHTFVDAVRTLARRNVSHDMPKMYRVIAQDFPQVALALGFEEYAHTADDADAVAESIETSLKEIRRGRQTRLIPAFIQWMWLRDATHTTLFLAETGFDLREELDAIEAAGQITAVTGTQSQSGYTLENTLSKVSERLVLVAQNHWHMITAEEKQGYRYWPIFADALLRGVDIDIIAMHPLVGPLGRQLAADDVPGWPDAIALWSLYANGPLFAEQIDGFWHAMRDWDELYRSLSDETNQQLGRFRVFGAYFTPLTMTVIDPDKHHATLIVSPRTPDPKATIRPQFAISKTTDPTAFAYYYSDIAHALSDHHWVKMVG